MKKNKKSMNFVNWPLFWGPILHFQGANLQNSPPFWVWICKICFLLAFVWFAGLVAFNYKISHYQVDENVKTDAIVVLTGGAYRIKEAFRLLNEDLSDTLFISGVEKKISLNSLLKAQHVAPVANKKIILEII